MQPITYEKSVMISVDAGYITINQIKLKDHKVGKYVIAATGNNVHSYVMLFADTEWDMHHLDMQHSKIPGIFNFFQVKSLEETLLILGGGTVLVDHECKTILAKGKSINYGRAPKSLIENCLSTLEGYICTVIGEESAAPEKQNSRDWYLAHGFELPKPKQSTLKLSLLEQMRLMGE